MILKSLLIATTNKAKIKETSSFLQPLTNKGVRLVYLEEIDPPIPSPQESGKTFCANAKIKAEYYAAKTKLPTLADDGGLTIDYLDGAPGVLSHRFPGYEASDEKLINITLKKLANIPKNKRTAQLRVCLHFFDPNDNFSVTKESYIKGYIAKKPCHNWQKDFPFRALFIVSKYNRYLTELSPTQHRQVNHRHKALNYIVKKLLTHYAI